MYCKEEYKVVQLFKIISVALAFAFTTYNGYARLAVGADLSILPSDDRAKELASEFLSQLDVLQHSVPGIDVSTV
jgi:hypothetical protein